MHDACCMRIVVRACTRGAVRKRLRACAVGWLAGRRAGGTAGWRGGWRIEFACVWRARVRAASRTRCPRELAARREQGTAGGLPAAARGGALLHGTRGFRRPVDPLVGAALRAARGLVGALGVAA